MTDDDPACPSTSVILIRPTRLGGSSSLTAPLPGALQLLTPFSLSLQPLVPFFFHFAGSLFHLPGAPPFPSSPPSLSFSPFPLPFLSVAEEETLARSRTRLTRGNSPLVLLLCAFPQMSAVLLSLLRAAKSCFHTRMIWNIEAAFKKNKTF